MCRCKACNSGVCTKCVTLDRHICPEYRSSSWINYYTGWGRNGLHEDCMLMGQSSTYMADMASMSLLHSRDAFTPDLTSLDVHRAMPPLERQMSHLSGDTIRCVLLTASGSDANNSLKELANYHVNRTRGSGIPRVDGEVIVMLGATVASRGPLASLTSRDYVSQQHLLFEGAGSDKRRSLLMFDLKLNDAYMQELPLAADSIPCQPTDDEARVLDGFVAHIGSLAEAGMHVGVLLIELVTADTMKGFSCAFLVRLKEDCIKMGILLVVDEVMTALRCGRMFAYSYYSPWFKPDYVTVGKTLLFCGVLSINASPGSLQRLDGQVTSATDEMVLIRSHRFLEVVINSQLLSNVLNIGNNILQHVKNHIEEQQEKKAGSRKRGPPKDDLYIRGIGAMWVTNLLFKGESAKNILYQRLLPPISMDPKDVWRQLLPK